MITDNTERTLIDRRALVARHNPVLTGWDPKSPLSVGNGDFAFTADFTGLQTITGLQTFNRPGDTAAGNSSGDSPAGAVPLCTMAQWGFHSYPGAPKDSGGLRLKEYARTIPGNTAAKPAGDDLQSASAAAHHPSETAPIGRESRQNQKFPTVGYMTDAAGQEELYTELRVNPHRFHVANIGLFIPEEPGDPADRFTDLRQTLDLWTGELFSRFRLDEETVLVRTLCHPELPHLAVRIESSLLKSGVLGLALSFPYGSHTMSGADWSRDGDHVSRMGIDGRDCFRINREMDACRYKAILRFSEGGAIRCRSPIAVDGSPKPHRWIFSGDTDVLEFTVRFEGLNPTPNAAARPSPENAQSHISPCLCPTFGETVRACARHWQAFWTKGAAISFEGSTDRRAFELERRVILSRYLLAIQSLGTLPPAETGLTCNSWYGKFHLEMHPWHALHALLWNQAELAEQSLDWYSAILDDAFERARSQGYSGARWPKMTDPSGRDSPSPIGCLLCWQQPHIILFAELLYRLKPSSEKLAQYADRVFATAEFMADYPLWDDEGKRYVLGAPLIPAQENHAPEETLNPTFELEYWRWGLKTAIAWKRRLGEAVPAEWEIVMNGLCACPTESPGRYKAHENCTDTYGAFATDHPAMTLACGFLPPQTVDPVIMSNTCDAVLAHWNRESLWGWDFPALAMTFARLGRKSDAVDALLLDSPKNTYLANGHNKQTGHADLPLYLPGNGALLLAVAMMAAGWDGCNEKGGGRDTDGRSQAACNTGTGSGSGEHSAPGFPADGTWRVQHEGFARYL